MTGIVTSELTQALAEDIRTRGLLVWLDGDGVYSDYVDHLAGCHGAGQFPYPVFAFRGSFVRLMRESYPTLGGAKLPKCVIHLPGFSEDSVKRTPLYEAYKAGRRWRIALETVIRDAAQGHLTPQQLDALVGREDLTLETADAFLADHVEVIPQLRALLTRYGEEGLVVALLTDPHAVVAEFAGDEATLTDALGDRLERQLGMDGQWTAEWSGEPGRITALADALWAFLLCCQYTADMAGEPGSARLARLRGLSKEYHRSGARILAVLRRDHALVYVARTEEIATALCTEETAVSPVMPGKTDTFRFEAEIVLGEAFRLLDTQRWTEAHKLARIRLDGGAAQTHTFWVNRDRNLARTWDWVDTAAALGEALAEDESDTSKSIDLAGETEKYLDHRWTIDQLHRRFTLKSAAIGAIGIDTHMAAFSRARSYLVRVYRGWIDTAIRTWNVACERDGFLPDENTRQRVFYGRHVAPALRNGTKTAVVLADALRYELGLELEEQLRSEHIGTAQLTAMLAELPTITAVGMSALAPTASGDELVPVFSPDRTRITGFRGGTRDVTTPATREKTFADVCGVTCAWQDLNTFLSLNEKEAKRVGDIQLLIVATDTVDHEGEGDALSAGIDYFDTALNRIISAVRRLGKLGYRHIVITADHGFIIGDDGVETGRAAHLPRADRRYALGEPRFGAELVSARLAELRYRTDAAPIALVFDRTSHLLSSRAATSFYHGGNSPQERIIPVLTVISGTVAHREPGAYRLDYQTLPDVLGQHRIRITATETSAPALFEKEPLEMRVVAEDTVTVTIADVSGGEVKGDLVTLLVGTPCDIYFRLRGSSPRSRLRFVSARPENTIENGESTEYFDVDMIETADTEAAGAMVSPVASGSWEEHVETSFHTALRHLQTHGALSERFLVNSLGGSREGNRKARRFALKIDEWQPYLPFRVTVHYSTEGKEYRKS